MSGIEQPWEELHHRSYILPKLNRLECDDFRAVLSEKFGRPMVPLICSSHIFEGNMANLSPMIHINISHVPGKSDNVYIWANCSPDDIKEYIDIFK